MTSERVQFGAVRPDGLEPNLLGLGEVLWAADRGEGALAVTGRGDVRFSCR
ncbi:hypothetical protein ACFRCW_34910 [Streptomyces sp. NPDC056653]|uniref:hypothetical protein n=1 Tax=Streptomyces sp. NPDC056653 TaxID=3345894 RepID=UPI0036A7296E